MGARDVRAGSAYVEVMTKDSTAKGLDAIKGKLKAFGNGINQIKGVAVGVASTAGAATAAAVKKAIDTGSAIKDMADRFGLSYVAVQRLGFVADQTGTSIETLAGGIKKMQQGLGNGTLGDELTALGISLSDIQGKSPEQQFAMIATAIGKMTDPAKKTAAAMAIFGKAGSELVPLTGEIQSLMATFDGLGITMGDAAVEQAEALGDEIDKVAKKFEAMAVKLGTAVLPILERLIKASEGLMPDTSGVSPAFMQGAIDQEIFGDNTAMNAAIAASNANAQTVLDRAKAEAEEGRRQSEARREAREAGMPEPGTGNSPLAAWLRRMQAGSVAMNNSAVGRDNLKPVLDSVAKAWERIGRNVERDQNKERIRERRQIQSDLKEVNQQISDAMSKSISFGSFDKRDLLGGVFQDVQHSQLKELRESKKLLEKLLAKKGGLPAGV